MKNIVPIVNRPARQKSLRVRNILDDPSTCSIGKSCEPQTVGEISHRVCFLRNRVSLATPPSWQGWPDLSTHGSSSIPIRLFQPRIFARIRQSSRDWLLFRLRTYCQSVTAVLFEHHYDWPDRVAVCRSGTSYHWQCYQSIPDFRAFFRHVVQVEHGANKTPCILLRSGAVTTGGPTTRHGCKVAARPAAWWCWPGNAGRITGNLNSMNLETAAAAVAAVGYCCAKQRT